MTHIDVIASETSLRDDCCNAGSQFSGAFGRRIDHHAREPRRQWECAQLTALFGDTAGSIDGAELGQKFRGFAKRGTWRRVEERKLPGIALAPLRQVEHE